MKAKLDDKTRVSLAIYRSKFKIIQKVVSNYYNVSIKAMENTKMHQANISKARKVALYFCRKLSPHAPLKIIGIVNGNGTPVAYYNISNAVSYIDKRMEWKSPSGYPLYKDLIFDIAEIGRLIHIALYAKKDLKTYRHRCHMRLIYKRSKLVKP